MTDQPPPPEQPQQPWQPPGATQYPNPNVPPPPPGYGYGYAPAAPPTPGNATTALILGIVGLVMCPLTSIPAIFVGLSARREIDASNGQLGGRSTAQAGYILGVIGTVLWVVVLLGLAALFLVALSTECTGTSTDTTFSFNCS